jgi:tryprostatin B 6-hydroxylase
MDALQPLLPLILGAVLGVAAHLLVFIRGEWHLHVIHIFLSHVGLISCLHAIKWRYSAEYTGVFEVLPIVFYSYLAGLFVSIGVYRAFFHPLRKFQGPWYARISKLWHLWAARRAKNHLVLEKIHQRYGDFVRTGRTSPNKHMPSLH